jgi:hypothetical protein
MSSPAASPKKYVKPKQPKPVKKVVTTKVTTVKQSSNKNIFIFLAIAVAFYFLFIKNGSLSGFGKRRRR